MTKAQEQIAQQALELPPEARAELAEKLWASLNSAEQSEIDKAWAEEADRRLKAIEDGEMDVADGSEIRKLLRDSQK
jgi:putative addiction module component (TIGR02574 family)